jgi:hypothetical protein
VFAASVRAIVADVVGNVITVESVPASVMVLLTVSVLPSRMVKVAPVAGAVRVILLIDVAEATPSVGVTNDGEVVSVIAPEPLTFWPSAVATPVPKEVMPVPPLATANVPATTMAPVVAEFGVKPVVPNERVETPVPAGVPHVPSPRQKVVALAEVPELRLVTGKFPVTPVVSGKPLRLVAVPEEGVPKAPLKVTNAPAEPTLIPNAVCTQAPLNLYHLKK